jgi:AcrR family transcriptional regulator
MDDLARRRLLSAMAVVVDERGAEMATATRVIGLARVSRATFYRLFDDRNDCLLATLDRAAALAARTALEAWEAHEDWLGRVRAALHALLELFDREPQVARLCVVHSNVAYPEIAARRAKIIGQLALALDGGREQARLPPPPLTAEVFVGGALSVIHSRLVKPEPGDLADLTSPLTALIAYPYCGARIARRELRRSEPASSQTLCVEALTHPRPLGMRMTYRTVRVISVIAAQPGLSNFQVSRRAGIADQGQISKLLRRLVSVGLVENFGPGHARGGANAWQLTREGERLAENIDRELLNP